MASPNVPSRTVLALCAALVVLTGLATYVVVQGHRGTGAATIGGPFALVDQDGRPVTEAAVAGHPYLVFFGYTHCPDVCPTTLNDISLMLDALGKGEPVKTLFITVDPERDTPAVLKDYLQSFDPRIEGLTGSPEAVAAVEKAYRAYARKAPLANGDYAMDHTALVYLMDADGRFVESLDLEQSPKEAAAEVRKVL